VKIVASTCVGPGEADLSSGTPELIELRIDRVEGDRIKIVKAWSEFQGIPLIITLRSKQEGGLFTGTASEWFREIEPLLPFASYVDIEQRYSSFAPAIKNTGPKIVASYHASHMPSQSELVLINKNLRKYGDIPKIVVGPVSHDDVLILLSFTLHAEKPIITSIMGDNFRNIRPILPIFGSEWIFGHMGDPTSAGQYHINEL
jgi:3-dehydroquinate dehydratase-1